MRVMNAAEVLLLSVVEASKNPLTIEESVFSGNTEYRVLTLWNYIGTDLQKRSNHGK